MLAGLAIGIIYFSIRSPIEYVGLDFDAFWCAGQTLAAHANPYLNQPLHACERANEPGFFLVHPNVTIPAPLPPYALALLAPLSFIPFPIARALWWVALALAALSVGIGIWKIVGLPPLTSIAVSLLAVLGPAIFPGALAPIPIALTVFAALALQRGKWTSAAVLLGLAMVEPHMVLPACAATWLFVRPMRVRLLVVALVLAAVMTIAVGPAVVVAYFTTMLPIHALAEVNNLAQFSLTAALYHLGVPAVWAVRIGFLQYLALTALGVILAARFRGATGDRSWLVLLPAACAVTGGAFIHLDQVAMVIPVGCLLLRTRPSPFTLVLLLMLAIPGEILVNWLPFSFPGALICAWVLAQRGLDWKIVIAGSGGVIVLAVGILYTLILGPHPLSPHMHIDDPGPTASASITWGAFTALTVMQPRIWWTEKLLTIVPVLMLLGLTVARALRLPEGTGPPDRPSLADGWSGTR